MLHELCLTVYYLAPFLFKALIIPSVLFWLAETIVWRF